ncbi:MAG: DUF1735 domain-containing protein [Tannerellaceae bacterium]|nr:DUF1735 domain-containing protein [Tannerellaceae bacterium]
MKKLKNLPFVMLLLFLLGSCSDDLMNPTSGVNFDPGLASAGFNQVAVVSLNETETYVLEYTRKYGYSKELTMDVVIDQEILSTYNTEKGTSYKLLPAEYYNLPNSVSFLEKSKSTNITVEIYSKKLFEMAGSVEEASTYALPVRITANNLDGIDYDEELNTALLAVNMSPVTVSVNVPEEMVKLEYVQNSGAVEEIQIVADINFSGLEAKYLSVIIDTEADITVGEVDYTLLPEANYTFEEAYMNSFGEVVFNGKVNADNLSEDNIYILPVKIQSSNPLYVVNQDKYIYFIVELTDLRVTIVGANQRLAVTAYSSLATYKGFVNVELNSMLGEDLTIHFEYDPSLVVGFNSANGTDYGILAEGLVSFENKKIPAGEKSVAIPVTIDLSSLPLDKTKHWLVPLVLKEEYLELGDIEGEEIIFLDVSRNLIGEYNLEVLVNERPRSVQNTIWDAADCQRGGEDAWKEIMSYAQYGFGGDGDWYAVLFSVTDEDMEGKPNCKKIEIYTFLEVIASVTEGAGNDVLDNKSYFNTVTGEVYIDCRVYESWTGETYKETYSFTLK